MKNKLISQKTRSRASKVVLALFLCTIMISSLCSFTVGDTFTFPETPPEYDYQTYAVNEGETTDQFAERVFNYGMFTASSSVVDSESHVSVPFYYDGALFLVVLIEENGITDYAMLLYSDLVSSIAGYSLYLVSYTDNEYTTDFLNALIPPTPTPTESLTNVWDGILNWITTSISSLQNVFWQEGTVIDFNSDVDTSDAITINDTVLYKSLFTIADEPVDSDMVVNGVVVNDSDFSRSSATVNDVVYSYVTYDGIILFAIANNLDFDIYTNTDAVWYYVESGSAGLTLLGTLCCIAVAISVVFLLIGTIVNFLKLRS